jgi:hypothetical protein
VQSSASPLKVSQQNSLTPGTPPQTSSTSKRALKVLRERKNVFRLKRLGNSLKKATPAQQKARLISAAGMLGQPKAVSKLSPSEDEEEVNQLHNEMEVIIESSLTDCEEIIARRMTIRESLIAMKKRLEMLKKQTAEFEEGVRLAREKMTNSNTLSADIDREFIEFFERVRTLQEEKERKINDEVVEALQEMKNI